jgi:hypothetical protein
MGSFNRNPDPITIIATEGQNTTTGGRGEAERYIYRRRREAEDIFIDITDFGERYALPATIVHGGGK